MSIQERIIAFLQTYPQGIDDDELAEKLQLSSRQQANMRCRALEKAGLVIRRSVNGKIHNFWAKANTHLPAEVYLPPSSAERASKFDLWYWEGNVQNSVVTYLKNDGYTIHNIANTATREHGKDIKAEKEGILLWVSVKGYPRGTAKTSPTTQAGHWFKQVIFDMIQYREEDSHVTLAVALPDFPRYRKLAKKIGWFKTSAQFTYFWVQPSGIIRAE